MKPVGAVKFLHITVAVAFIARAASALPHTGNTRLLIAGDQDPLCASQCGIESCVFGFDSYSCQGTSKAKRLLDRHSCMSGDCTGA